MSTIAKSFLNEKNELIFFGGDYNGPKCEQNLGQYFLDAMEENANKVAQIDASTDERYTHGEVRKLSIHCALEMKHRGVKQGDMIGFVGRSGNMNLPIPMLAATYLGCALAPMHPDYSFTDLSRIFGLAQPTMIFCDLECKDLLKNMLQELNLKSIIIVFEEDFQDFVTKSTDLEKTFKAASVDPETSIFAIVSTSGTTGFVKGVIVTHAIVFQNLMKYRDDVLIGEQLLFYSPASWLTFIIFQAHIIFKGGSKIISEYDPETNMKICSKYKLQFLFLTPSKMSEMVNHPKFQEYPEIIENLKHIVVSGSYTSPVTLKFYQNLFKNAMVFNLYGSSELVGYHAYFNRVTQKEIFKKHSTSHGTVPVGCYWKFVDPETKKSVGRNTNAELCIKSNSLKGYYKEPEQSKLAIDEDGFFHTGDIGMVDDDGFLYIVGRCKDTLKYKGWHISTSELKEILQKHPGVKEACVVGKNHPADGDLPVAFIVKNAAFAGVTEQEIIKYFDNLVPDSHRLRGGVMFLDTMPLTPTGKINQRELKKRIAD